jgi:hypothetical protein
MLDVIRFVLVAWRLFLAGAQGAGRFRPGRRLADRRRRRGRPSTAIPPFLGILLVYELYLFRTDLRGSGGGALLRLRRCFLLRPGGGALLRLRRGSLIRPGGGALLRRRCCALLRLGGSTLLRLRWCGLVRPRDRARPWLRCCSLRPHSALFWLRDSRLLQSYWGLLRLRGAMLGLRDRGLLRKSYCGLLGLRDSGLRQQHGTVLRLRDAARLRLRCGSLRPVDALSRLCDRGLLRLRDNGLLRPRHRARLGPGSGALMREHLLVGSRYGAWLGPGDRILLRPRSGPLLGLWDSAVLGPGCCTAQLFDTPAVALLDAGGIGPASAPLDHPGVLHLIEPGPPGARLAVILPGIDRIQFLVEPAEPWVAADQLFVRAPGVTAVEALTMRRRADAEQPGAYNKQEGQQYRAHGSKLRLPHAW